MDFHSFQQDISFDKRQVQGVIHSLTDSFLLYPTYESRHPCQWCHIGDADGVGCTRCNSQERVTLHHLSFRLMIFSPLQAQMPFANDYVFTILQEEHEVTRPEQGQRLWARGSQEASLLY